MCYGVDILMKGIIKMEILSLVGFFIGTLYSISIASKLYMGNNIPLELMIMPSVGWTLFASKWILT